MRIITINLNGIRSAAGKDFFAWLAQQDADVVCLQELKAQAADMTGQMLAPPGYHGYFHYAEKKGYSGVGIYTRHKPDAVIEGLGFPEFDCEGRYLEAQFGNLSIVSVYLPSGSSGEERQAVKFRFMAAFLTHLRHMMTSSPVLDGGATRLLPQSAGFAITSDLANVVNSPSRMAITNDLAVAVGQPSQVASSSTSSSISDVSQPHLHELRASGREMVICGDWNIAHKEIDLKNWRGNRKNSGFLPEERAWLTGLFDETGFVDVFRRVHPEMEAYTWWSNRGRAWDKNVGWRIDYQIATPGIAARAQAAAVYKTQRFSDHAPLIVDYAD
jgi:exodeoxyribonuclease-3